jgi:hypothetical protein
MIPSENEIIRIHGEQISALLIAVSVRNHLFQQLRQWDGKDRFLRRAKPKTDFKIGAGIVAVFVQTTLVHLMPPSA